MFIKWINKNKNIHWRWNMTAVYIHLIESLLMNLFIFKAAFYKIYIKWWPWIIMKPHKVQHMYSLNWIPGNRNHPLLSCRLSLGGRSITRSCCWRKNREAPHLSPLGKSHQWPPKIVKKIQTPLTVKNVMDIHNNSYSLSLSHSKLSKLDKL